MIARLIVGLVRLITGMTARWAGPSRPDRPCVYFANHASHLDAVVIWAALDRERRRRTRPVAARDYWQRGALRRYLAARVFHAVLIERHRVTRANNPLDDLAGALEAGFSLIMFPEGTRAADREELHEFQAGIYHLARRVEGLPLVPVHLENLNRILPKGEVLPVPLLGSATFGEPISLGPDESKEEFLARARQAVIALEAD
ncbi:MAG: hypothetical protein BIFFINMI_02942 [Phycisphaerae bacterium]|nr:hypothetical protein [Phycisphaerae bacterium]